MNPTYEYGKQKELGSAVGAEFQLPTSSGALTRPGRGSARRPLQI